MGFTEALTFMLCAFCRHSACGPYPKSATKGEVADHLNRYVIRPRVRSYGDNSTSTRSPGRILMKFIRIFPDARANTSWPFGSSTLNVVFGKASLTRPSTSIASFLAKCLPGFRLQGFKHQSNAERAKSTSLSQRSKITDRLGYGAMTRQLVGAKAGIHKAVRQTLNL